MEQLIINALTLFVDTCVKLMEWFLAPGAGVAKGIGDWINLWLGF
jgi:hypothetical protein